MAIARRASVTVSMAEEMIGMLSVRLRVSLAFVMTWLGSTSDGPGRSNTSSNVSAVSVPNSLRLSGIRQPPEVDGTLYAGIASTSYPVGAPLYHPIRVMGSGRMTSRGSFQQRKAGHDGKSYDAPISAYV